MSTMQLCSVTNKEGLATVTVLKWNFKPKKVEGLFNMFHIRSDNVGHWPDDCVRSRCIMPRRKGYTQSVRNVE